MGKKQPILGNKQKSLKVTGEKRTETELKITNAAVNDLCYTVKIKGFPLCLNEQAAPEAKNTLFPLQDLLSHDVRQVRHRQTPKRIKQISGGQIHLLL